MPIGGEHERHVKPSRVGVELPLLKPVRGRVVFGLRLNQSYSDGLGIAADLNAQGVINTALAAPARPVADNLNSARRLFSFY